MSTESLSFYISGGCCGGPPVSIAVGSWKWCWWLVSQVQRWVLLCFSPHTTVRLSLRVLKRISLSVMTLTPTCEDVETFEGVPLTVTGIPFSLLMFYRHHHHHMSLLPLGVAQVKVMREDNLLRIACEQFLDRDPREIMNSVLQTLEGHLRAILGTLTVEAIYKVGLELYAHLVARVLWMDWIGRPSRVSLGRRISFSLSTFFWTKIRNSYNPNFVSSGAPYVYVLNKSTQAIRHGNNVRD